MGAGDEIMALGRAELQHIATGQPCAILDRNGNRRDHELWHHNPAFDKNAEQTITDGSGVRPYITRWEGNHAIYNLKYRPRAGKVHLTMKEYQFCSDLDFPFAVVSPTIKDNASPNKDWGEDRWEEVIDGFPLPVLQLGPEGTEVLPSAVLYRTPTMRHAAAVVARSAIVLTAEGGIHHLAASMSRPAVVVHGGFTPPEVTGYKTHVNLTGNTNHTGCGKWEACPLCMKALDRITPAMVKEAAQGILYASAQS